MTWQDQKKQSKKSFIALTSVVVQSICKELHSAVLEQVDEFLHKYENVEEFPGLFEKGELFAMH